jgi:DNA gyrase/topoisomerase IV subunit B
MNKYLVNGNATNQGGTHVNYITNQIHKLKKMLEEKKKIKRIKKPNFIKR